MLEGVCVEHTFHFQIGCRFSIGSLEGNLPGHIQLAVIKNQDVFLPVLDDFTVLGRVIIDSVFTYTGLPASHHGITLWLFFFRSPTPPNNPLLSERLCWGHLQEKQSKARPLASTGRERQAQTVRFQSGRFLPQTPPHHTEAFPLL